MDPNDFTFYSLNSSKRRVSNYKRPVPMDELPAVKAFKNHLPTSKRQRSDRTVHMNELPAVHDLKTLHPPAMRQRINSTRRFSQIRKSYRKAFVKSTPVKPMLKSTIIQRPLVTQLLSPKKRYDSTVPLECIHDERSIDENLDDFRKFISRKPISPLRSPIKHEVFPLRSPIDYDADYDAVPLIDQKKYSTVLLKSNHDEVFDDFRKPLPRTPYKPVIVHEKKCTSARTRPFNRRKHSLFKVDAKASPIYQPKASPLSCHVNTAKSDGLRTTSIYQIPLPSPDSGYDCESTDSELDTFKIQVDEMFNNIFTNLERHHKKKHHPFRISVDKMFNNIFQNFDHHIKKRKKE